MVPGALLLLAATWVPLAPVLVPRQEVAAATVNGKIYLIGGIAADQSILDSVEEYDPRTNSWRFVAPLPRTLHHTAAAVVGEHIYVIGGYESPSFNPRRAVYRYDTRGDAWTEVAPLPSVRGAHVAVTIDGKIYVAGGSPTYRELLVYDPKTDVWTPLAPMPTSREHLSAAAVGGQLYVAGGRLAANTDAFERYDAVTNTWTVLPDLPTARGGLSAAAVGSRIYVFGGEGNPSTPTGIYQEVESFDVVLGTWRTEIPMANPRHGIAAVALGNRIYIPAGAPVQGYGTTTVHDALVIEAPRRRSARH